MKRRFILFGAVFVVVLVGITACSTNSDSRKTVDLYYEASEDEKLSSKEMDSLIYHARKFITRSKALRLDKEACKKIQEQQPGIRTVYSGKKEGRIDFEWMIGDNKVLQLTAMGKLTSEKVSWHLQIKSMRVSDPYMGTWRPHSENGIGLPPDNRKK